MSDFRDDTVYSLLDLWSLSSYKATFQANEVDLESLLALSEKGAADLINLVGPRTRLIKNIQQYKNQHQALVRTADDTRPPNSIAPTPNNSTTGSTASNRSGISNTFEEKEIDADLNEVSSIQGDRSIVENKFDINSFSANDENNIPCPTLEELVVKQNRNDVENAILARKREGRSILANYSASRRILKKRLKNKIVYEENNYVGLDSQHQKLLCEILVKEDFKNNP